MDEAEADDLLTEYEEPNPGCLAKNCNPCCGHLNLSEVETCLWQRKLYMRFATAQLIAVIVIFILCKRLTDIQVEARDKGEDPYDKLFLRCKEGSNGRLFEAVG